VRGQDKRSSILTTSPGLMALPVPCTFHVNIYLSPFEGFCPQRKEH